ncbi:endonuclease domain-containing protein [Pararhizobium capsulatum]|uniref:endonuclease domain-containing protein n=1 Tax=Pararhizobium capsulatum TaxID=34014 RepID=UPI0027D8DDAD|nr:DUF559 domain-containing protein [Pararhizobium capsulatum]
MGGYEFRRQVPLHTFILDFVCFETRLIVEVDGFQHAQCARDLARDALLWAKGFRTIRFWNETW